MNLGDPSNGRSPRDWTDPRNLGAAFLQGGGAGVPSDPRPGQVLGLGLSPGPLPEHAAFQIPRTFNGVVVAIEPIITLAHNNDLPVYVFIDPGEETPVIYNELIDAGVDGIITDRPRDLQAVLVARGVVWAPGIPGIPALPPLVLLALGVGIVLGGAWATRRARDNSLGPRPIRSNSCVEA